MQETEKVDPSPGGIRDLRKRLRMTQAELAEKLGYSRNYVTLMETGSKPITEEVVHKLTALLTPCTESTSAFRDGLPSASCPTCQVKDAEIAWLRTQLAAAIERIPRPS